MSRKAFLFLFLIGLISCQSGSDRLDVNVDDIQITPVKIKRYGKALFAVDNDNLKEELKNLQPDFGIFLNGDINDTLNLIRIGDFISDPMLIQSASDCNKIFSDLEFLENELTDAFKHYKYYFLRDKIPGVYTYVSGFDYDYPVQFFDNNLIIALDMYLGAGYKEYLKLGVPAYRIRNFDRSHISRDCMDALGSSKVEQSKIGRTLLDNMINKGKSLYFIKAMIPELSDSIIMDYTNKQLKWSEHNESNIWAFLIENELLYSVDPEVMNKFIVDAPFTSYFGNESAPRTGMWIGYKIVKSFMDNNTDITLSDLMQMYDSQAILTKSGYKPE